MVFSMIDWLMDNLFFFWLVVALLFLIMEMGAPGLFFFLSFFFGAFICAFSTFLIDSLITQSIIFLIGTAFSFFVLHMFVRSRFAKQVQHERSNIYALEGRKAIVTKKITADLPGQVRIFGDIWTARTLDNQSFEVGQSVTIVQVKGAHLIVKK